MIATTFLYTDRLLLYNIMHVILASYLYLLYTGYLSVWTQPMDIQTGAITFEIVPLPTCVAVAVLPSHSFAHRQLLFFRCFGGNNVMTFVTT
jgi:hypothetical protein